MGLTAWASGESRLKSWGEGWGKRALGALLFFSVLVLAPLLVGLSGLHAKSAFVPETAATVAWTDLPPQGQQTYRLIFQGGPFAYDKDGTVFGNRERLLPRRARGYYREYTVKTPGSRDRGARRIVCGGAAAEQPEVCFYTDDHYASFRQIVGRP